MFLNALKTLKGYKWSITNNTLVGSVVEAYAGWGGRVLTEQCVNFCAKHMLDLKLAKGFFLNRGSP